MHKTTQAPAGLSLLIGSLLIVITMGLHPTGGSFDHLVRISSLIIISHSIALLALPFCWVGFWGLTLRLSQSTFLSQLAFCFSSMGLMAGLWAAGINGLMLPLFIGRYQEASRLTLESIKPNLALITTLNQAFDFMFIGGVGLAVLGWSAAILKTKALPGWTGWLGLLLPLLSLGVVLSGRSLVHLTGFRVFTFGLTFWIICVGYRLQRPVATEVDRPT